MSAIVIDTNVLLVADGKAAQMSEACRRACLARLETVRQQDTVVLDFRRLILNEYRNKISSKSGTSPGTQFLRWLLQVMGTAKHVTQVSLEPLDEEQTRFREFPRDPELEEKFDPSDRKFVAVSNVHPEKPPILQAADSKWIGWENDLAKHQIRIEFVCRDELEAIRNRKIGR